jgi:hypothetical protein
LSTIPEIQEKQIIFFTVALKIPKDVMGKFLENAFIFWPGHTIASDTQFCSMEKGVYTAIRTKITTVATPTIGLFLSTKNK